MSLFFKTSKPALGPTQPPVSKGNRILVPVAKWQVCEVNYLSPFRAAIYSEWSYISTPPVCLNGVGREVFTFKGLYREHILFP